eukprot:scaffold13572_cov96-Isochrysis_galbana.AAC.2
MRPGSRAGLASGPEPPLHDPSARCSMSASSACLPAVCNATMAPSETSGGSANRPSHRPAAAAASHWKSPSASSATARCREACAAESTSRVSSARQSAASSTRCSEGTPASSWDRCMQRQKAGASLLRKTDASSHAHNDVTYDA